MAHTVLIIDDDPQVLAALSRTLERKGYEVEVADTGRGGLQKLPHKPIDMVLIDLHLPDQDGLSVLSAMRAADHNQPVLMMSGEGSIQTAVKAVQLGAIDFIQKPWIPERVLVSVENALKYETLVQRNADLEAEARPSLGLLGQSPTMGQLRALVDKAAPTEGRVLITGENGTGKELVARAIHMGSRRAAEPLIKLSCAAIPAELIESELFGHERGAFTGAVAARRGKFERADGGTLFLDEVGEMPVSMQAKLLRVLQEGELERVGGSATVNVDVRVVSATNRDLEEMMKAGNFREDLYYRLNVIHIQNPPLRQHKEDIPELATTFLMHAAQKNHRPSMQISDGALRLLAQHDFPGNVRELQNIIERVVILADSPAIDVADVRAVLSPRTLPGGVYRPGASFRELLEEAQRQIVLDALSQYDNNMADTARSLGLERSHLYKKCRTLGIQASKSASK